MNDEPDTMIENTIDEKRYSLEVKKHEDFVEIEQKKIELEETRLNNEKAKLNGKVLARSDSTYRNPLIVAIFGATIAALGNIYANHINAENESGIEQQKAESALILKMLETAGDIQGARDNLQFLLDAGLIDDQVKKENIKKYLKNTPDDVGPSVTNTVNSDQKIDIEDRSVVQLVELFRGADRLRASEKLVEKYNESPDLVTNAVIDGILPVEDRMSYRVNLYISLTLSRLKPNWKGTVEQRDELAILRESENYKDAQFQRSVDLALGNFRTD